MCHTKRLIVLTLNLVLIVALPSSSSAFQVQATAKQAGNKVARWYTQPVAVEINQEGAPGIKDGSDVRAVRRAMDAWTVPSCNNLKFTSSTSTTTSFAGRRKDPKDPLSEFTRDGKSVIRFETKAWEWSKLELARNATYFEPQSGKIIEADLLFNAVHFKWSTDQAAGTVDIETVALARVGFMLGLWFSDTPGALLHPSTDLRGVNRTLSNDDIDGSCFLYPTSGWNNPPPPAPGQSPSFTEPNNPGPEPTAPKDAGATPTPDGGATAGDTSAQPEGGESGGCQCTSRTPPPWVAVGLILLFALTLRRQHTKGSQRSS